MSVLLHDVIALIGPDLEPRRVRELAIEGGRVASIGIEPGPPLVAMPPGGLPVLLPGLWNGHTHVGDSVLPDGATGLSLAEAFFRPAGFKYRELAALDPEVHRAGVEAHLRSMLEAGIVGHFDFREQGAAGARLLRLASRAVGIRSVILSQFDVPPFDERTLEFNRSPLPEEARAELAAILAVADGFSESTMNDLTDTAWAEIREATAERGALRAIHCLEDESYRSVSVARTGRGDLVRALEIYRPDLVVHLTVARPEEIALLARSGTTAVVNPRANAALGLPLPPIAALLASGVNLLLGTDNGMLNGPDPWRELDFAWKLACSQAGPRSRPDPVAILRMVTTNVGGVRGRAGHGVIEVGAPADLVVVDGRAPHLAASRHLHASLVGRVTPADVLGVMVAGEWRREPPANLLSR